MSAAIRAGRAYVELFLKDLDFNKALDNAKLKLNAWKASLQSIGVAALGIGTAMVTPFAMATKAAGDMAETMSKLKVMFGEGFGEVDAWLDKFSSAVGRSKKDAADAVGAFQAMFVGMGMTGEGAGELAKEMTSLAIDFGSFHNVTDTESIERLISAFAGSSQVFDMFGINIKESNLNLKLLEMGFETCQGGATELQKILARAEIIRETMGKQGAIGDAIRTADSFSNTFKRVRAEVVGAMIMIGQTVMPIFRDLMAWFSVGLKAVMEWAEEHKTLVQVALWAAVAITGLGSALLALSGAISVILYMNKAVTALRTAFVWMYANPFGALLAGVAIVAALTNGFGLFGSAVGKVSHAMQEQAEANKKARSESEVQMDRLKQLAEKQSLSNDESREAAALIDVLQSKYGNLGLSIDSATGKIIGMTEAQKALSAAMKAQEIADVKKEMNEAEKNIQAKHREATDGLTFGEIFTDEEGGQARLEQARKDREVESERLRALQARLDLLEDKGKPDVSAAESEKRRAADEKIKKTEAERKKKLLEEGDDAAGELEGIDDERRRAAMTETERQIDDVKKKALERQRLLIATTQGEHAREGGPRQEVLDMLNMLREKYAADEEADIAAIEKKAADEEAKKAEDARRSQLDDIARKELDLKFAAKAGETEEQASKREHEKRLAMIELERKQAMDNLKEGLDPNLVNQDFDLQKRLAEAEFNARGVAKAEDKINAAGSFAAAIVGQLGSDDIDKQQLTGINRVVELLRKIEKKEGGIGFGNA
jgi:hypothetical protein